jgi:hypothetical protein
MVCVLLLSSAASASYPNRCFEYDMRALVVMLPEQTDAAMSQLKIMSLLETEYASTLGRGRERGSR